MEEVLDTEADIAAFDWRVVLHRSVVCYIGSHCKCHCLMLKRCESKSNILFPSSAGKNNPLEGKTCSNGKLVIGTDYRYSVSWLQNFNVGYCLIPWGFTSVLGHVLVILG